MNWNGLIILLLCSSGTLSKSVTSDGIDEMFGNLGTQIVTIHDLIDGEGILIHNYMGKLSPGSATDLLLL